MSLWSRLERRLSDLAGEIILDDYRDQVAAARVLLDRNAVGDAIAAVEMLEALLRDKPDHGGALVLLGAARLQLHRLDDALDAFDRGLKARPDDPAALLGRGNTLLALARDTEAIASFTRAISEARGDRELLAEAYLGVGTAWRRTGDFDKAVRELRKAVAEAPTDLDARAALGDALLAEAGAPTDEARRHLDKATEAIIGTVDGIANFSAPVTIDRAMSAAMAPTAWIAQGRIAVADGALTRAASRFAYAKELLDGNETPSARRQRIDALIGIGDAALAANDPPAAHLAYLEALALDGNRAATHAKIGDAHRAIGSFDMALPSYERALALGAGVDVLRAALATATAAGDADRQVRWANDLLMLDADSTAALVARGLGTLASGQPDAARALLTVAAARGEPAAHVGLARVDLAEADGATDDEARARCIEQAIGHALAALRTAPADPAARQLLADARRRAAGIPSSSEDILGVAAALERVLAGRRELGHLVGDVARATSDLDQPLLVTVMGEFSSGKSSFVNAFVGADVAPTGITPTTATINVVRYGGQRGGRIIARDGHTRDFVGDALFDALRELPANAARDIDHVEILVPLPQLGRINIVDTPGLNSIQPEHEATARAFITRADAVVWVFTAGQGGKASERKALAQIHAEGRRVLGVLNKSDQLTDGETTEVVEFIRTTLGEILEDVVPFSARHALSWKRNATGDDGNWSGLEAALESRFFAQARKLKRDACARRLRVVLTDARAIAVALGSRSTDGTIGVTDAVEKLRTARTHFVDTVVAGERRALADATTELFRRAAREVLELVQPRRIPFGGHTATPADRDYLIALLDDGFANALSAGRMRVAAQFATTWNIATTAAEPLVAVVGSEVHSDIARVAADAAQLALSQVFDRARAYLRGYLAGGYVEAFFRLDLPKLDLSEDAVYHALIRGAPDLDGELATPLARAGEAAISSVAARLQHWAGVADVTAYDLEISLIQLLDQMSAALAV